MQRGFASDRIQLQIATLCYMVAIAFGGSETAKLSDFVVDFSPRPVTEPAVASAQDGAGILGAMSGRGVRVLGQKRKHHKKR